MRMDLVFVLKWVKSAIGCTLFIFHLSVADRFFRRMFFRNGRWILIGFTLAILYLFYAIDHNAAAHETSIAEKVKGAEEGKETTAGKNGNFTDVSVTRFGYFYIIKCQQTSGEKMFKKPFRQAAAKLNPSKEIALFKKPKNSKVATFVFKLQLLQKIV